MDDSTFTFDDFVAVIGQAAEDPVVAVEAWELYEAGELSIEGLSDA